MHQSLWVIFWPIKKFGMCVRSVQAQPALFRNDAKALSNLTLFDAFKKIGKQIMGK